jgi:hypothetical protein
MSLHLWDTLYSEAILYDVSKHSVIQLLQKSGDHKTKWKHNK